MPKTIHVVSITALAFTLFAGYAAAHRSEAGGASCTAPPPPGSPGYAEAQAIDAAQAARNDFSTVCVTDLARYDLSSRVRPMADTLPRLAFPPVALDRTPFAKLKVVGGVIEQFSDIASGLYRVFQDENGRAITLFEHDMSADGSQMSRAPGDEQQRVNGLPARLAIVRNGAKTVSTLTWNEGRRAYELSMDGDVTNDGRRARLFSLAASLLKSVPAKTDEQLSPFSVGPDGMPIIAPAPPTLEFVAPRQR